MNESKLTPASAKKILQLAKEWREQGKEDSRIHSYVSEMTKGQSTSAHKKVPKTKENALKEIERSFVKESLSHKNINMYSCQELIQQTLMQRQQEQMFREQHERELLQRQIKQRNLSKGVEMEL